MPIPATGASLTQLRESFGLRPWHLADLLGVGVATVYRWEASPMAIQADPRSTKLLGVMAHVAKVMPEASFTIGSKICVALGLESEPHLRALHVLLKAFYEPASVS